MIKILTLISILALAGCTNGAVALDICKDKSTTYWVGVTPLFWAVTVECTDNENINTN